MKRLVIAIAWMIGAGPALAIDFGKIIDIGRQAVQQQATAKEFSEEDEIGLGQAATASFLGASPLHPDANLQRYVNRVGRWLALHSDRPDLPWTFAVIETDTINAFAFPGGNVVVSSGLLKRLGSESELAGVLAHEIAHVSLRHGTTQASRTYLARTAVGVVDTVAGFGRGDFWRMAAAACSAGVNKFFLRSNRAAELQADAEGARLLAESGFDPRDMANFFERLDERGGNREQADAGSDHPDPASRVEAISKVIAALGQTHTRSARDSEEFRRIKSRLSGLR